MRWMVGGCKVLWEQTPPGVRGWFLVTIALAGFGIGLRFNQLVAKEDTVCHELLTSGCPNPSVEARRQAL